MYSKHRAALDMLQVWLVAVSYYRRKNARRPSLNSSQVSDVEYKINIGSGISGALGWCNFDNSPTILLSRLPVLRRIQRIPRWPRDVRRHDVRKGLPFADQSAVYIYSSHTFEHFTWNESLRIAKECYRVLSRAVLCESWFLTWER